MTHSSALEQLRLENLLRILPRGRKTVLEIGARHGFVTRVLRDHFESVTALDLEQPPWTMDRVIGVKGNVEHLQFPDNSFDCVLCTEVLEHVPDVAAGAREILRVARHEVILGVPYRQDTRVGRTTCLHCGRHNPPYGHLHEFDEARLEKLFAPVPLAEKHYISETQERTNRLSAWLHDRAGNPYGVYDQEEPCIHCGHKLERPPLSGMGRVNAAVAERLFQLQMRLNSSRPMWIHCVFRKK